MRFAGCLPDPPPDETNGATMKIERLALYAITAVAEIVGCYLPYAWLRLGKSPWLLVPGGAALAVFAWLLTLHPAAAGRTYAAYGGVYIAVALLWLWLVEKQAPSRWDLAGAAICLIGVLVMVLAPD